MLGVGTHLAIGAGRCFVNKPTQKEGRSLGLGIGNCDPGPWEGETGRLVLAANL